MPVIPTSDQFARQTPNLRTGVNTVDLTPLAKADQALGKGIENLGQGIVDLGEGIEKKNLADDTFQYGLARSKFLQDTIALEDELKNSQDYTTIPTTFAERMTQIKSETLGQVKNPRLAEQLGAEINLQTAKTKVDVDNIFKAKQGDADRASLITTLDDNKKALLATGNEDLKKEILFSSGQLIESLKARGSIDEEAAVEIRNTFLKNYAENRIASMSDDQQIKAIGAKRNKNGEVNFAKTNTFADYIPAETKIRIYNQAKSQIDARNRAMIREDINDVEQAKQLGLIVPTEKIKSLAARAAGVGMPEVASSLNKYALVQDQANIFATKSIDQQKAELTQIGAGVEKGNIKDVDKYAAFKDVLQNKVKLLKDDPYSYYEAHNIIQTPAPLNISDPNSIAQNLQARRIEAEKVRKIEGNNFTLPLFTKEEIGQLKFIYENKTPAEIAQVIANIGSQLNQQEKIALAGQLAKDDDKNKILATAMALSPKHASDLLIGKSIKGEVKEKNVIESFASKMKGYITDPLENDVLKQTVFATYKKKAFDAGNIDVEINSKIMDESIEQVIGKPMEISIKGNKSKVFSFKDNNGAFIDDGDLEDIFRSIDDKTLKQLKGSLPIFPSGDIMDSQEMLKKSKFISQSDGVYIPYIDGLGSPLDAKGNIYTIDARKVKEMTGGVPKDPTMLEKMLKTFNPISEANGKEVSDADMEQFIRDKYKKEFPYYEPSPREVKDFAKKAKQLGMNQ